MTRAEWDACRSPARLRQLAWLGGYKLADLIPACDEHGRENKDADCDACLHLIRRRVPDANQGTLTIEAPLTLVYGEFGRAAFLDACRYQRKDVRGAGYEEPEHVVSHILGRRVREAEYMTLADDKSLRDITEVLACLGSESDVVVIDGLLDRLHPNACKRMVEHLVVHARRRGVSVVVASNSAAPLASVPRVVPYKDVVLVDAGGASRVSDLRDEYWLDQFRIESLFAQTGFARLRPRGK